MIEMIAVIEHGHWKPGIGDPTVLGWVTTIAYFVAAGLCGAYALQAQRGQSDGKVVHRQSFSRPSNSVFWWSLTIFMLLMGINKQLDLQVLVLQIARKISLEQGWSAERTIVRKWMVVCSAFVGLILIMWLVWVFRRVWRRYALALFGVALLGGFLLIRASGGRVTILGHHPGHFPMFRVIEIGGIVCIGAAALIELCRLRQKAEDGVQKTDVNSPASDL
jgi:hypothetical protein